jgi:hypothetical protein
VIHVVQRRTTALGLEEILFAAQREDRPAGRVSLDAWLSARVNPAGGALATLAVHHRFLFL